MELPTVMLRFLAVVAWLQSDLRSVDADQEKHQTGDQMPKAARVKGFACEFGLSSSTRSRVDET